MKKKGEKQINSGNTILDIATQRTKQLYWRHRPDKYHKMGPRAPHPVTDNTSNQTHRGNSEGGKVSSDLALKKKIKERPGKEKNKRKTNPNWFSAKTKGLLRLSSYGGRRH